MGTILLVILGVAILASFFVAYMSAQSWPIYQAVLVVFLFMGTVAFFYLGARTLATHKAWRDLVNRQQAELTSLEAQLLPLEGGMSPQGQHVEGEIPTLRHELAKITRARGGVFYDVTAESVNDGVVQLKFEPPKPPAPAEGVDGVEAAEPVAPEQPAAGDAAKPIVHGLDPGDLVFAFEQKPVSEGGRYLGEFKVVAGQPGTAQIEPSLPLTESQSQRLEAAVKTPWTLYTTMPLDDPAIFAGLDEAERQALLPAERVAEYAQADREHRDYLAFFHESYAQRSLLHDAISKLDTNIERTEAATAEALNEGKFREAEQTNLQADLASFRNEIQAITAYEKSLDAFFSQVLARLKATYIENRRAASLLTSEQFKAAAQINRQTAAAGATPR